MLREFDHDVLTALAELGSRLVRAHGSSSRASRDLRQLCALRHLSRSASGDGFEPRSNSRSLASLAHTGGSVSTTAPAVASMSTTQLRDLQQSLAPTAVSIPRSLRRVDYMDQSFRAQVASRGNLDTEARRRRDPEVLQHEPQTRTSALRAQLYLSLHRELSRDAEAIDLRYIRVRVTLQQLLGVAELGHGMVWQPSAVLCSEPAPGESGTRTFPGPSLRGSPLPVMLAAVQRVQTALAADIALAHAVVSTPSASASRRSKARRVLEGCVHAVRLVCRVQAAIADAGAPHNHRQYTAGSTSLFHRCLLVQIESRLAAAAYSLIDATQWAAILAAAWESHDRLVRSHSSNEIAMAARFCKVCQQSGHVSSDIFELSRPPAPKSDQGSSNNRKKSKSGRKKHAAAAKAATGGSATGNEA